MVSAKLRERVLEAAAELGYQPNLAARTLASVRTNSVGVIVPSLAMHIFTDVLRGIYDGIQDTKLRVLLGNSHYDNDEEERLVREFLGQKPAAMIVSGAEQNDAVRTMLENANCPVIQIMDLVDDPIECIIGFSHFDAGYQMTRHLLENGYQRIGFIAGWVNKRSHGRQEGWRHALQEAGLFDPKRAWAKLTDDAEFSEVKKATKTLNFGEATTATDGRLALRRILEVDNEIDAVFCNNDILALGVLFEAQAMGLRVPDELGIAGFNDTELVRAAFPSLSSLRTPRYEIGKRAVQEAVKRLGNENHPSAVIDLGIKVSARESTDRRHLLRTGSNPADMV